MMLYFVSHIKVCLPRAAGKGDFVVYCKVVVPSRLSGASAAKLQAPARAFLEAHSHNNNVAGGIYFPIVKLMPQRLLIYCTLKRAPNY
jgi:hypothetical protein